MDLTPDEQPVVRCAVVAYHEVKKRHKGPFRGTTADEILEELKPSLVRWTTLAALGIETAEGPVRRNRGVRRDTPPAPKPPRVMA